jgi:hypothetical protein
MADKIALSEIEGPIYTVSIRVNSWLIAGDDFDFAIGDGGEEILAIGFVDYAGIQNNYDAGIGFASNQPAKALLELENRRRQLIVIKRIAALLFDLLETTSDQRLVRDGKRKANDDNVAKRRAGDIDALPKTIGAKKGSAILGFKQLQKRGPVKLRTLLKQADAIFRKLSDAFLSDCFEHLVTGKKYKSPALCFAYIVINSLSRRINKRRLVRVGKVFFDIESNLLGIIERRAEFNRPKIIEADAAGEELKSHFRIAYRVLRIASVTLRRFSARRITLNARRIWAATQGGAGQDD